MARFTFFTAGEEHDIFSIRAHMLRHGRTPLFDDHGLAMKDSLPQAVRCASRHATVTHALLLHVEPWMMLDIFMQGFATRSFRNSSAGVDLQQCPIGRYRLEVEIRQLTENDLLFSSPRTPDPDWMPDSD